MNLYVRQDQDDTEMYRIFERVPRKYQGRPSKDTINLWAIVHSEFVFSQVSDDDRFRLENGEELKIEIKVVNND